MIRPGPVFASMGPGTEETNVFGRIALFAARHAGLVIAVYLLLASVALAFTIVRIEVNTDPGEMISKDLDFRRSFADFKNAFPELDNTFVVVVDGANPELGREGARALSASFAAKPELFQNVYAPGISPFFDTYGVLYQTTDEIRDLVSDVGQAGPLIKALAERPDLTGLSGLFSQLEQAAQFGALPNNVELLLTELARTAIGESSGQPYPLDWGKLGGASKNEEKRWYVVVKPRLDFTQLDPAEAAMREAREIVADPEVQRSGRVVARLTGEAAVNAEEFEAVITGAALAGAASFCLVVTIIGFGMPSLRLIVPALVMLVLGIMITAGFATVTVGYLNMISVAFAVLFIGLGIDYAIHVLLRYAEYAKQGLSRYHSIGLSVTGIGPALAVCTLTTSLAFLAFVPTDFVGMAQLGIIAAGGIVIAFAASLTLIPAVLALLPLPLSWQQHQSLPLWVRAPATTAHRSSVARMFAAGVVLVATVVAALTLPSVRFDGDPINLKDPDSAAVQAFRELLQREPGSVYAVQVLARNEADAKTLASELKALASVDDVRSINDFVPDDQSVKIAILRALRDAVPDETRPVTPGDEASLRDSFASLKKSVEAIENSDGLDASMKIAASVLKARLNRLDWQEPLSKERLQRFEQAVFARLPSTVQRIADLSRADEITPQTLDASIRDRYLASDGRWRLEVVPKLDLRDQANLRKFAVEVRSVTDRATGPPVEISGAADTVASSITIASLSALGLVILVLLPLLRRPLDVALIVAPIAMAAILLCAYTVLFNAPFNFANVIVLPLLLGLGVDSAVHYVMRAREEGSGNDVTITSTPRAVLISALTTIGSFGTLWLSPHLGMSSMGELLTIAIFISLICTLVVLPQLIDWTIGRRGRTDLQ